MPLFGHKKSRTSRAATIGTESTLAGRFAGAMRDRGIVLRVLMCLLAIAAMVVAVEAWKAPFRFRKGSRSAHGILAATGFDRVNRFETEREKADQEAAVPLIFRHDPQPLQKLPTQLRTDLEEIARAPSLDAISNPLRASFGLLPPEVIAGAPLLPNIDPQLGFRELRKAVGVDEAAKQAAPQPDRLDDVVNAFQRFVAPLEEAGIVDPADLNRIDIRPEQRLAIIRAGETRASSTVSPPDVQLSELLKEKGLLGESWQLFATLAAIRPQLESWLTVRVRPTLKFDSAQTQQARRQARNDVEDVSDHYNRGDVLVPPGGIIDENALTLLRAEYDQTEQTVSLGERSVRVASAFLLIVVLSVLNGYYLVPNERRLVRSVGRLGTFLAAIVMAVALGRFLAYHSVEAQVIPLIVTVMVLAIAYDQMLATITALSLCLIMTLSTFGSLGQFVVLLSVAVTAVIPLSQVSSRSTLIKVGFAAGVVYLIVSFGAGIIQNQTLDGLLADGTLLTTTLYGAGWCLAAGYLVAGSLPFIESAFGIVTDISLLEMSDVSHPLLQELVRRAPGTYNHSISVASIAETAADKIGANGLLVRVGAYFHDIGKMLKPQYFVENFTEGVESPHAHLAPAMSTLVIIGHVKDGVDLARQHNLPQPLVNFIEQHHGTTLVQYFYYEAARQADRQPDHRTDAEESSFRYPGPKPQSREAGVLMLADAVESASRTLRDPAPRRIENLVHEITMSRLMDGQFDESSLTLSQIRVVEESLTKSLIGIYHGRIKYPEQRTA